MYVEIPIFTTTAHILLADLRGGLCYRCVLTPLFCMCAVLDRRLYEAIQLFGGAPSVIKEHTHHQGAFLIVLVRFNFYSHDIPIRFGCGPRFDSPHLA